jgi:HSP20 family protein
MKKRSFFDRLSGAMPSADDYESFDDEMPAGYPAQRGQAGLGAAPAPSFPGHDEGAADGQLPVDVYQTENEIVVRAFVAGVRPDDINLSISRDMVAIDGVREEREQIMDGDYIKRELFWGTFATTILLPQEIDVDNSTASAKDGLLTLVLPRLDKSRQTKLKVKAG